MQHIDTPRRIPARHALMLLAVMALGCLPGWFALDADFLADDLSLVRAGADMVARDFPRPWTGPWMRPEIAPNWPGYDYYRPLVILSFGLDGLLWGQDPRGYHLTNLLLHAGCVALFYFIALRLCSRTGRWGAAAATLIFALHPVHEYSVLWLAGRTDLLCAAFYLAAVLSFLRARDGRTAWNLALATAFAAMAILSKEMAYSLPLVCAALHFIKGRPVDKQDSKGRPARLLAPLFLVAAALFALRPLLFGWGGTLPNIPGTGPAATLWMSARHLVLPFHLSFKALLREYTGWTLLAAAVGGALVAPLLPALRSRAAAAGTAWTLLALLPAANLFMPWYMYIPSAGFSLLAGHFLTDATGWRRVPAALLALVLVTAYAAQWQARVPVWRHAGELARNVTAGVLAEGGARPVVLLAPASAGDVPVHAHNLPARLQWESGGEQMGAVVAAFARFPADSARQGALVTPVNAHTWDVALCDPEAYFVFPAQPPGVTAPWGTAEIARREPFGAPVALRITLTPETAARASGIVYYSAGTVLPAPRPESAE